MSEVRLFGRKAILIVDTIRIECGASAGLDISFNVEKTIKPDPNTAEVRIWNLTREHQQQLAGKSKKDGVEFVLEAGYIEGTSAIAEGTMRYVFTERDGPDLVTVLGMGDGDAVRRSRIAKGYSLGTPVTTVLRDLAKACGVGVGNLETAIKAATLTGGGSVFKGGTAINGNAYAELVRVLASCGLTVSIQHGRLQILGEGKGLEGRALELSAASGLIMSPTVDQKGILKAQTLMIPDLLPGRKIVMKSRAVEGSFIVQKARYSGDTAGNDWTIDIEAKAL